jgi:phage shock protein PspC (stress-responsive transcriptional regulator)
MKKVININFSGRLINIEEDAYAALQSYIESLKKYFSNEEGQEEIIADIENRIAEIFYDKQTKGATSITISDVNEVANLIGKPEDFEPKDDTQNNTQYTNTTNTQQKQFVNRGKLYRDGKDKILGGICSGVASYFNIDTVLVRVLFAVLVFSGFGVLLYFILWVVLPENNELQPSMERRLFRNNDDKMVGGVASGLASYFSIDTWIPRLIFAAPFLLTILSGITNVAFRHIFDDGNFFKLSIGGTTTIIYFILWWLIPEAITTQEKMAMKGEKLDLESIKNNVQDGIKNFSSKAKEFGDDITKKANEWSKEMSSFGSTNGRKASKVASNAGQKIGSGIGIVIKGFALFIGGIVAFSLLMALFSMLLGFGAIWPVKDYVLDGFWQNVFAWGSIVFLLVPAVAFVIWIVRRVFKIKKNIYPAKVVLSILFFVGLISCISLVGSILNSGKNTNSKTPATEIALVQPTDKLLVQVNEPEVVYSGELPWINIDENGFDITKDTLKYNNIKLVIEQSPDSAYHFFIKKLSHGNSVSDANNRANNVKFNYSQIGNTLNLGSHLSIDKGSKFRLQKVTAIVQVPIGKKIRFDETVTILKSFGTRIVETNERRKRKVKIERYEDYTNYFDYAVDEDYVMTKDGNLEKVNKDNNINSSTTNDNDEEIEEKLRELKELQNKKILDSLEKEKEKIEQQKNKIEQERTTLLLPTRSNNSFCMISTLGFAGMQLFI